MCFVIGIGVAEISDVRGVLQLLIDQVSLQQTTSEQVLARINLLEETGRKQQMFLNDIKSTIFKRNERNFVEGIKGKSVKSKQHTRISDKQAPSNASSRSHGVTVVNGKHKTTKQGKGTAHKVSTSKQQSVKHHKSNGVSRKDVSSKKKKPAGPMKSERSKAPIATPVRPSLNALSSSEIDRSSLVSIDSVVSKYQDLIVNGRVVSLARKLAIEAVIGLDVLKRCTPCGRSYYPALPVDSLYTIKQVLLDNFPEFWDEPQEFDVVWRKSVKRIDRVCSTLRRRKSQTKSTPPVEDVVLSHVESPSSLGEWPVSAETDRGVGPDVAPITTVKSALPSSEIPKSELMCVSKFMALHSTAIRNGKYEFGHLTRKLAYDVVFGEEVLRKCTPFGHRPGLFGLPVAEFNMLKQLVLNCYPSFWDNMDEFERRWHKICLDRLSKVCSKLRRNS